MHALSSFREYLESVLWCVSYYIKNVVYIAVWHTFVEKIAHAIHEIDGWLFTAQWLR